MGYVQDIASVARTCDPRILLVVIFDPPRFSGTRSTHAEISRPARSARTVRRDSTRYRLTFRLNDKRFVKSTFEISAEIDILRRSNCINLCNIRDIAMLYYHNFYGKINVFLQMYIHTLIASFLLDVKGR